LQLHLADRAWHMRHASAQLKQRDPFCCRAGRSWSAPPAGGDRWCSGRSDAGAAASARWRRSSPTRSRPPARAGAYLVGRAALQPDGELWMEDTRACMLPQDHARAPRGASACAMAAGVHISGCCPPSQGGRAGQCQQTCRWSPKREVGPRLRQQLVGVLRRRAAPEQAVAADLHDAVRVAADAERQVVGALERAVWPVQLARQDPERGLRRARSRLTHTGRAASSMSQSVCQCRRLAKYTSVCMQHDRGAVWPPACSTRSRSD